MLDGDAEVKAGIRSLILDGRPQPLLHAIIFFIQVTMVTILVRKFNAYYANRPVLTTMITNAVSYTLLHPPYTPTDTITRSSAA